MLQGGSGTNQRHLGRDAFAHPSAALSFEARYEFALGDAVFERPWVVAPSSTIASDGLGPLFNARSCLGCHIHDGRGHPPQPDDPSMVSMLFALSDPDGNPDPKLGHQFQDQAIPGMRSEGKISIRYEAVPFVYPDGRRIALRKPVYSTKAELSDGVSLNPRIAPPLMGLGLVEAVSDADILRNADPDDRNGDGVSGRPHWLEGPHGNELGHKELGRKELGRKELGRNGWKATAPSIKAQSARAFSNDMGLSTRLFPQPWGDCTPSQTLCRDAQHGDEGGSLEIADSLLELVTFYVTNLAVPARRDIDDPAVLKGKALFYDIGCTGCHTPKFATRPDAPKALRNQLIWPYSDFLLHDMGPGLADANPTGNAGASEWRTQPLWGIGLTERVNAHSYFLHDGRARSLEEAILWHGGEAAGARDGFANLSRQDRDRLIRFLESL